MSKLIKRNAVKYDLQPFFENLGINDSVTEIYVDVINRDDIEETIRGNLKKFRRVVYEMHKNHYNSDLYGKEEVSEKARNVTAIKFKGKENIRIGCKEFFRGGKKVVMIVKIIKKVQKNDKKLKNIYETIGGYDYEFK
jgi:hypothetical protein